MKVYVVQDENDGLLGAKLSREAANSLAEKTPGAKVTPAWADKRS